MLYQKLHLGDPPYLIGYRTNTSFPIHKHHEIELFYCTQGNYNIIIDRTEYWMKEGDLAVIGSMVPHELPESNREFTSQSLVIEVGPTMLGNLFSLFVGKSFSKPIYSLKNEEYMELYSLLQETELHRVHPTPFSSLIIKGNIYKIFAYILERFLVESHSAHTSKQIVSVMNIENSLEYIYQSYQQPLSVEKAAAMCGYSKSNFCKIFKQITGETFHNVLNRHRVKVACTLLEDTELSVEDIAVQVGFLDAKSFCRIFRSILDTSPGAYRKQKLS